MPDDRTKRITIWLTEEELKQLNELASDRGFDKQQLLRYLVNSSHKDLIERKRYAQGN